MGTLATDTTLTLLDLAGSVALLLWGVHMIQSGVQRALGSDLRRIMATALGTRWRALPAGLGVTALIQSSTATALMVTSFAASGAVDLVPALAAMLGANIGSTLTVQVLSFNITRLAPVFILVGVMAFRKGQTRARDLGRVSIGLGLMILALARVVDTTAPFENAPGLRLLMGSLATDPVLDVLLGAVLTWLAHSSVAIVLLVMSLAANGVVPPAAAFPLVIGANIGTAINPVLEGGPGDDPVARRLPFGNLALRVIGGLAILALLEPISRRIMAIQPDASRAVADFHTGFNVLLALVAVPLLTPFARLLRRLFPQRIDPLDPSLPVYLDKASIEVPSVAMTQAAREALRMSDVLGEMMASLADALIRGERRKIAEARRLDDILDRLNSAIRNYLAALDPDMLEKLDHRRLAEILAFATNIEHAGDAVEHNVLAHAAKRLKRGLSFSPEEEAGITAIVERLNANLTASASVFMAKDPRAARLLAGEKRAFRDIETDATDAHFSRMRRGRAEGTEPTTLYIDLVRDLKLVNSHLVAASAYPILENEGELRGSRLRADD